MKLYKNKIVVDGVESALNIAVGNGTTGTAITYTLTKEDNNIILTGSDGTTTSVLDSNTTYDNATNSAAGLMSKDDKAKLDGITANANSVNFSRSLTSGTKIGTITINGTGTELYAPIDTWRPVVDNLTSTATDSSLSAAQGKTLKDLIDNQATNITNLKKPQSVTLGTSWSQDTTNGYYTQTVALSGITSKDNPTIDVVLSGTLSNMQAQQDDWGKILKVETLTNTLKFYASETTTTSLSVIVKGV